MEFFDRMERCGFEFNLVLLMVVVLVCLRLLCLERGKEIYKNYVKRRLFELDEYMSFVFLDMYGKCGCLEMVREGFEYMFRKSLVVWNFMIRGFVGKGDSKLCIDFLSRMIIEGIWFS